MSKINCNPDLYWELYAKVLPLEEAAAIKLFNSAWIKSLSDEEINELLKLSRLKALAILELHTFTDSFPYLTEEKQSDLINSIKCAKTDEIAIDAKDCYANASAYCAIQYFLALITSRAKNNFESACCLEIATLSELNCLDRVMDRVRFMKLIVSSNSLKEAKRIYRETMLLLAINYNMFDKYICSFHPVEETEAPIIYPGINDAVTCLEEIAETPHPVVTGVRYTRKPGHRHNIKAKDLE